MIKKTWKKALAGLCAAAMVMTSISWPTMSVNASENYERISHEEMSIKAGSDLGPNVESNDGHGHQCGPATAAIDGCKDSFWHSKYNGGNSLMDINNPEQNYITLTLDNASDLAGVTYMPRQYASKIYLNGNFKTFKVDVSSDGEFWTNAEIATVNGQAPNVSTTFTDGQHVTVTYVSSNNSNGYADEKVLVFKSVQENVKYVKFTVRESYGVDQNAGNANKFLNAAELGALKVIPKAITDIPEITLEVPELNGEAPNAIVTVDRMGAVDKAENPVKLLGNAHKVDDDSIESDVYTGSFTVEGGQKLDRTGAQTLAISFKYKRNTAPNVPQNQGHVILKKHQDGNDTPAEYTLVFTSATNLQLWGQTNSWSQHDMTIGSDFWGKWHDITICFTKNKYEVFVDGVVMGDTRPGNVQVLQDRNLPFVFNPTNDTEAFFADFKMYTDLNSDFDVSQQTSYDELNAVLENATKLFEIGEGSVKATSEEFSTSTTWTNIDGTPVDTFGISKPYTATVTLRANAGYYFSDKAMPQVMVFDGEEVDVQPKLSDDRKTMTIEYIYSQLEGLLHTDEFGTFVYASDLPYTKQQNHNHGFTVNENVSGNKIELYNGTDGTSFDKGFMCHAPGSISFDFAKGDFVAFSSYYGVDYASQKHVLADKSCAMVDFALLVNNETVMEEKNVHVSSVLPHTGLINLKEANSLKATFASGAQTWNDHSVLADAKLYTSLVAEFTEASASLTGTIGLNFYVQVNDAEALDNLSVRLTRQKENATEPEVKVEELKNVVAETSKARAGWYKVTFNVAAKEMTDDVKAEILLNGDTVIATATESVKTYATKAKEYYKDNTNLVALLDAMLNYGAVAQHQFEYKNEEEGLPTLESLKGLYENTTIDPDVDFVGDTDTKTVMTISRDQDFAKNGVDISEVSLLLKEDTVLRLYLKVASGVDMSEYTVTPELANGKKYAEVKGISAQNLEDRITFTITGPNDTMATVVYSPLDYAKAVVDSDRTSETLKTVAKALYEYYVCAEAYFN